MFVAESEKMPSAFQSCVYCGELVVGRNLTRHVRRHHNRELENDDSTADGVGSQQQLAISSRSPSRDSSVESRSRSVISKCDKSSSIRKIDGPANDFLSADYMRDAVLCMLRRTTGVNAPNLAHYLSVHFPEIPEASRWPLILGTFTAAQRVALAYADVLMDADPDRVSSAKLSLARWLHGLSAVEPGQAGKEIVTQRLAASSQTVSDAGGYSPTTNFLVPRNLPIPLDSQFGRDEMNAHFSDEKINADQRQDLFEPRPRPATAEGNPAVVPGDLSDVEPNSAAEDDPVRATEVLDGQLAKEDIPSEQAAVPVIAEERVLDQNPKNQVGCSERSMDTDVGKDQSGDQQISTQKSGDLDNPMLSFSDLVKLHDADALTYSDLIKPLLLLSPPHSPTVALSPMKLDHEKLDKRTTDVGKVSRRKKEAAGTATQNAAHSHVTPEEPDAAVEASKRAKPDNGQPDNACSSAKRPKMTTSPQPVKSAQVKSAVSTTKSGLDHFKTPLLSKENRSLPSSQSEDRHSVMSRCYQQRKETTFRRTEDSRNFKRFRPPPENRRYTLDRRSDHRRERDRELSASERYWLSKIPPHLKYRS